MYIIIEALNVMCVCTLYISKSITLRSDSRRIAIQIYHEVFFDLETISLVLVFSHIKFHINQFM